MENPLVSFLIGCYNQEAYIREAMEGAFAQDYSPLEIVVSDDCSTDGTFAVAQQVAREYRGPHRLVVTRTPSNRGLTGNCNHAFAQAKGELFVLSAGDDISVPHRTRRLVQAWNESGRQTTSLHSRLAIMDEQGKPVDEEYVDRPWWCEPPVVHERATVAEFVRRRRPHVRGCTHAISRKLIELFGPLPEGVVYEDTALSFRTVLAGGTFTFVNEPLVRYRRHARNITFALHNFRRPTREAVREHEQKRATELERFVRLYEGFARDAERAASLGLISAGVLPAVRRGILREGRRFELRRQLLLRPWLDRVRIFCALYLTTIRPREALENARFLLPKEIYIPVLLARERWHAARSS